MDCNLQVLLSTGFPRKDTGVGCHLLLQGNFPNPEIKPTSPALAGKFFTTEPPGKPQCNITQLSKKKKKIMPFTAKWMDLEIIIGEGNGNPVQCSYLENPRDGGAWWAAVYGVAQSRIRLKRLSSSSRDHQSE